MKITIEGTPKEIADLKLELKDGKGNKISDTTIYYVGDKEIARSDFKTRSV